MRDPFSRELLRVMSPTLKQMRPVFIISPDVKSALERLKLAEVVQQQARNGSSFPHTAQRPQKNSQGVLDARECALNS